MVFTGAMGRNVQTSQPYVLRGCTPTETEVSLEKNISLAKVDYIFKKYIKKLINLQSINKKPKKVVHRLL